MGNWASWCPFEPTHCRHLATMCCLRIVAAAALKRCHARSLSSSGRLATIGFGCKTVAGRTFNLLAGGAGGALCNAMLGALPYTNSVSSCEREAFCRLGLSTSKRTPLDCISDRASRNSVSVRWFPSGATGGGELELVASDLSSHFGVVGLAGEQIWVAMPAVDVSVLTGVVGSPASLAF